MGQSHVPAHSSQTPRLEQAGSPQRLEAAEERMRSGATLAARCKRVGDDLRQALKLARSWRKGKTCGTLR